MKNIKEKFIRYTARETLLYKIVDYSIFKLMTIKNWIRKGHLIRHFVLKNINLDKLHLGCDKDYIKEFINSDVNGNGDTYINICKKLPFKDNTLKIIYSSHLVEHIYRIELIKHLNECYRVLKKNGKVIIQTPDLEKLSKIIYSCDTDRPKIINWFQKYFENEITGASLLNGSSHLLFGHKYLYDFYELKQILQNIGFKNIECRYNFNTSNKEINEYLKNIGRTFWNVYSLTIEGTK